jgi:transcriptional regulator with XRE-family HTH domain
VALDKDQLAFGERLRALRVAAGFETGKALAEHLGWVAPKVSRIENGNQLASDADLVAWLDAVHAPEDVATETRDRLRELRLARASWRRRLRTGHAPLQVSAHELERKAARIVMVEFHVVPGLVQTAEYARAAFAKLAVVHQTPRDTDAAVRERMRRQEVLYDPAKQIELLVAEAALRNPICPASTMRGQLDRLAAISAFNNVRMGVIPLDRELPIMPMHGFWMIDDQVLVEIHHSEVTATDPDDLALYNRITDALWTVAVEGEQARALLTRIAGMLAG